MQTEPKAREGPWGRIASWAREHPRSGRRDVGLGLARPPSPNPLARRSPPDSTNVAIGWMMDEMEDGHNLGHVLVAIFHGCSGSRAPVGVRRPCRGFVPASSHTEHTRCVRIRPGGRRGSGESQKVIWRRYCERFTPVCPQEFPRVARGLDYNLNWSLAGDRLTTRGEAYRNASVRDLIEFTPRSGARVTKGRALIVDTAAPAATASFATDVVHGTSVMDVAEAESRTTAVSARG